MHCWGIRKISFVLLKTSVQKLLLGIVILSLYSVTFASEPWPGMTLLSQINSNETVMIDIDGNVVKTWHGATSPSSIAYFFPDGSILRPCKDTGATFDAVTAGGRIQLINGNDQIEWDYLFSDSFCVQHHDIEPLPNGNVLLIAWERRTMEEAIEFGRVDIDDEIWPTLIVEVEPVGSSEGNIVWEWHLWDHLIQDEDSSKPGYGVISEHPGLININYGNVGGRGGGGDWIHANAIDYNEELDQIVFSSRSFSEIYIIDHSTTTEEAASHAGGLSGMGGDLLYRWGNPQVYECGTGTDQYFSVVHGVNWIDEGLPGEGNLLCFNNGDWPGSSNDFSTVDELVPPLNSSGTYDIGVGEAFGPESPVWTWGESQGFYAGPTQCGAYRVANGNTLVTSFLDKLVQEVDSEGSIVWEYSISGGGVARAQRYSESTGIDSDTNSSDELVISLYPNPASDLAQISFNLLETSQVEIAIFDMLGRKIITVFEEDVLVGSHSVCLSTLTAGIYFCRISAGDAVANQRFVVL